MILVQNYSDTIWHEIQAKSKKYKDEESLVAIIRTTDTDVDHV